MQVLNKADGPLDEVTSAKRPITIRNLLTHTAGIGYLITSEGPLRDAFVEQGLTGGRVSRLPIPGFPPVTPAPDLATFADRLATLPLIAEPGDVWSYSASLDLLGRVIEVVSGMSIYLDPPKVPSGGGGLVSSPKDYDRFQRMLLGYGTLDGNKVMEEASVRLGTSNILPETVDLTGSWVEGQGFGAGGRVLGANFSWGGAAGTLANVDFDRKLRSALFTQYMPTEAYPIRADFMAAYQADLAKIKPR
jgi:CubicO group peptidase (beta-lactamase class C family)